MFLNINNCFRCFLNGIGQSAVHEMAFQEPDDDPKPFLYLWIAYNSEGEDDERFVNFVLFLFYWKVYG